MGKATEAHMTGAYSGFCSTGCCYIVGLLSTVITVFGRGSICTLGWREMTWTK